MADQVFDHVDVSVLSSESSSHHARIPTRIRTRKALSCLPSHTILNSHLFLLILLLTSYISLSSASTFSLDEQMVENREVDTLESTFAHLARSGTILVDRRPPPIPVGEWSEGQDVVPEAMHDLRRRKASSSSSASSGMTTLMTSASASSSSPSLSSTSSSISSSTTAIVAVPTSTADLPSPFDLGFSGNITSGCQSFMDYMLTNTTFKSCLPFSLLLQNSYSFFQVEKSVVRITQTLDFSCGANLTQCSKLTAAFASNLTSACASDLSSENPIIQQARLGLMGYKPLYSASCLRNPTTAAYCFADAITGSNSADAYVYFLPLNNSLVGGSQPTCSPCLKNTMNIFEAATADRSSALAIDYVAAAQQINVNCGPGFVNSSLAAAAVKSASTTTTCGPSHVGLFTLVLLVVSWLL